MQWLCGFMHDVDQAPSSTLFQYPTALILQGSTAVFKAMISEAGIIFSRIILLHLSNSSFQTISKPFADAFPALMELYLISMGLTKLTNSFLDGIHIKYLNLSLNKIYLIEYGAFDLMVNIKILSLVSNAISNLESHFCHTLEKFQYLYLSDNPLRNIAPRVFAINPNLIHIESDWYMVCCVALATEVSLCMPQNEVISTCHNILASNFQNVVIQIQNLLAILQNLLVLAMRTFMTSGKVPESPLAYALTVADL